MDRNACLKNAQECGERADCAATKETKAELLLIATEWMRLAEEIDAMHKQAATDASRRCAAGE